MIKTLLTSKNKIKGNKWLFELINWDLLQVKHIPNTIHFFRGKKI